MKRSQLTGTTPLKAKRGLVQRKAPLGRSTLPMRKTRLRNRSAKYQDIPQNIRDEVSVRSRGLCEINATGCGGKQQHLHHVRSRAQGGTHDALNLIAVCVSCHLLTHSNPRWAHERGYLYSSKWAARSHADEG